MRKIKFAILPLINSHLLFRIIKLIIDVNKQEHYMIKNSPKVIYDVILVIYSKVLFDIFFNI